MLLLLALGIGANVAAFSLVNGILLQPLPYAEPDRLVVVREAIPERDSTFRSVNALHFGEWSACSCFEELALSEYAAQSTLTGEGDPARITYMRVTPNAFSLLGISAQLGRTLAPADAEPGRETNILISDRLWRGQLGSDPDIVGKTLNLDAMTFTVVGVLPPGFRYYAYGVSARLHELAMRMALGAGRHMVFSLVLRQGMRPVLVGIALGILAAIAMSRLLSSLLFGITPTDAATIFGVVAVTLAAALLASILPARRAAGTSVLRTLRYE